ncbi:MAG: translation initiation factor IF-2 [Bacteroidota bacterium]
MRLSKAVREFNVSTETIVQYLRKEGEEINGNPNTKLTTAQVDILTKGFKNVLKEKEKEEVVESPLPSPPTPSKEEEATEKPSTGETNKEIKPPQREKTHFRILGNIPVTPKKKESQLRPVTSSDATNLASPLLKNSSPSKKEEAKERSSSPPKFPMTAQRRPGKRITTKSFQNRRKHRKEKKSLLRQQEAQNEQLTENILNVTPFITVKELAGLMNQPTTDLLKLCLELGRPVSINQRLDEEVILFLAEHYNFQIQFVTLEEIGTTVTTEVDTTKLEERAPIVSVMGHVDHGKTSLLDFIRKTEVTQKEAGGITQHIGAYEAHTTKGKRIAFLDTPGHEAFTAMRARGAQLTDIAIIIVAADEQVMPQTKEAIKHAQIADVPIVIAINKVDKPGADPNRIKAQLADMEILVEELGGNTQCQEISAKTGQGIPELLDKVTLESDLLELRTDPTADAQGTVIDASLEKGKGYLANLMVQNGSLKKGNIVLAGTYYGKVKAMYNSHGQKVDEVPPSTPVQMLGLNGAPQAGEPFKVMSTDREARELASRSQAIRHQQSLRSKKKVVSSFEEMTEPLKASQKLNIIIKADVDGSVEALADSLLALSTPEVVIDILRQAVGPISDTDVLLAADANAHIIGFHTKVTKDVKKKAGKEKVDIQLYNLIHEAIQGIEKLIENRTEPELEEIVHGHGTLIQIFRVKGVGTIAGCRVKKGMIRRNSQIRIIRNDEILYQGPIKSLKIESEDVKEAREGVNCGVNLRNFDDLQVDDQVEAFEVKEV